MANPTNKAIIDEIAKGAVLSSDLYAALAAHGIARGQAKTAVTRLVRRGVIKRARLKLGRGATVLLSSDSRPNAALVRRLYDSAFFGRPSLAALVECASSTHPAFTNQDIAKVAALGIGTPEVPDWHEVEQLVAGLEDLGVLEAETIRGTHPLWRTSRTLLCAAGFKVQDVDRSALSVSFKEQIRLQLAASLGEWLMQNGFAAAGTIRVATEKQPWANYVGLAFDFFGLNYSAGIIRRSDRQITGRAIVGDVLLVDCNAGYARSFVRRVDQAAFVAKQRPISFILCRYAEPAAFDVLREAGVFVWTLRQLFGKRAAQALQETGRILERLAKSKVLNPERFTRVLQGLDNIETLGHIKGKLFELLIGYFFQKLGYRCRLAWAIAHGNDKYDVDVCGDRAGRAAIVECKGIRKGKFVKHAAVERHFTERTPAVRSILLEIASRGGEQLSGFDSYVVTSGGFTDETTDALGTGRICARADTALHLWDRSRLIRELEAARQSELAHVVRKYY